MDTAIPEFKKMHPQGAELPQECLNMTTHQFASIFFSVSHNVPTYQAWLDAVDMQPVYAFHHDMLRVLQWRCPPDRWVLKSSSHLWSMDALLDEYPDAGIIQTHRDPLKVVASFTSLVSTLRRLYSGIDDTSGIGEQQAAFLAAGLDLAVDFRERNRLPATRVSTCTSRRSLLTPLGRSPRSIASSAARCRIPQPSACREFLVANPGDKYGAHRYRFADTGLDPHVERRRFARYQERFAIASEPVI